MKRIGLAWELGGGLGHITSFLPLVKGLKESGFEPVMMLRDISHMEKFYGDIDVPYFQAPVWQALPSKTLPHHNFTDTLFHVGYLEFEAIHSLVKGWVNQLSLLKPDLMILDYSPSALIACRILRIPCIVFGNCFAIPPRQSPMPAYRSWQVPSSDVTLHMETSERRCVSKINQVLEYHQAPLIHHVYEIMDVSHTFITTDKQLDIYPRQSADNVEYLGAMTTDSIGLSHIPWPDPHLPKCFAYLKSSYEFIDHVLAACQQAQVQFVIYSPDLSAEKKQRYQSNHIVFTHQPCQISAVREQCDFAMIHGGNLLDKFLEAGKPVLLLPMQMEHLMMAHNACKQGVGCYFNAEHSPQALVPMIQKISRQPDYKIAAATMAKQMTNYSQQQQVNRVIEQVSALIDA